MGETFSCPECKDTGIYQGLNTVEPCLACGGKKRGAMHIEQWQIAQMLGNSSSLPRKNGKSNLIADVCQQFSIPPEVFSGQSIRHELEEQITEGKPFDEITPAELEGIAIGKTINVSIECKDCMRAFEVMNRIINRPIFGLPPQSFRFKSLGLSTPDKDGKHGITATLLYKPISKDDWRVVKNSKGEVIHMQCLYENDDCQDMLFILED